MKILKKEKQPVYYDKTIIDYLKIYVVDKMPKEREYIEVENKKGYVVSYNYDEEAKANIVYLEKNLDDWNNQISEICEVVYLKTK